MGGARGGGVGKRWSWDEYGGADLLRSMLDGIQAVVMVVDEEFNVYQVNSRARRLLLHPEEEHPYKQMGGVMLRCVYARDRKDRSCGAGNECDHCMLRATIVDAIGHNHLVRKKMRFVRRVAKQIERALWLVTVTPFVFQGLSLGVLAIEDVSTVSDVDRLISVCAECKKVRNPDGTWESFESYFGDRLGVDFSHAICPDCLRKLYPGFKVRH